MLPAPIARITVAPPVTMTRFAGTPSAADYALYPALAMYARYDRRRPELRLHDGIPGRVRAWMKPA